MNTQKYIVRTERAGVFYGEIVARVGQEIVMANVRRIHHWQGATECIGLATSGVISPDACRITVPIECMTIIGVIEVLPCTELAFERLEKVKPWTL